MTTQQMLDERYGRTRRGATRWAVVAGILAAVIAVVAFAWLTVSNSLDAVDADTTGFQVIDEHSVALEFQVSAPAGRTVACALEAQDREHGVVGWKVVELPPGAVGSRAFRETIPTLAEATTGFVNNCWVT
jgi:hypothetical protein